MTNLLCLYDFKQETSGKGPGHVSPETRTPIHNGPVLTPVKYGFYIGFVFNNISAALHCHKSDVKLCGVRTPGVCPGRTTGTPQVSLKTLPHLVLHLDALSGSRTHAAMQSFR